MFGRYLKLEPGELYPTPRPRPRPAPPPLGPGQDSDNDINEDIPGLLVINNLRCPVEVFTFDINRLINKQYFEKAVTRTDSHSTSNFTLSESIYYQWAFKQKKCTG